MSVLNSEFDRKLESIIDPIAEQTYPSIPVHDGVVAAFKELQYHGYITRANFWCCQSCGWYGLPKKQDLAVFYHDQDAVCMVETGRLALAWCGNGTLICATLNKYGIATEWGGTKDERIFAIVGTDWLDGFTIEDEKFDSYDEEFDSYDDDNLS